jgi:acyl dehydratase
MTDGMTSSRASPLPTLPGLLLGGLVTLRRRLPTVPPDDSLAARFAVAGIDVVHVARYRNFFDFRGDHVPLTYFYLLAQRAQLALMLDGRFPYPLPGLIHRRNDLRRHAVPLAGAGLEIDVSVKLFRDVGNVPKIDFDVEISQAGRHVVSCTSEYRRPARRRDKPAEKTVPDIFPDTCSQTSWTIEKSAIRRYAILSGDYNPIHLSSLLARLFGARGCMAHGMYAVGCVAAQIERQTKIPLTAITADFRRPILLPAQAVCGLEILDVGHGCYGVLLAEPKKLALSGTWEN